MYFGAVEKRGDSGIEYHKSHWLYGRVIDNNLVSAPGDPDDKDQIGARSVDRNAGTVSGGSRDVARLWTVDISDADYCRERGNIRIGFDTVCL